MLMMTDVITPPHSSSSFLLTPPPQKRGPNGTYITTGTFESVHVTNSTTFRYACQRRRILYNAENVRNYKNSEKQVLPFYLINAKNIDELNKSVKIILDFDNNTYLSNTVTIELWLNVYVDDK
jgi:hypothetical protein